MDRAERPGLDARPLGAGRVTARGTPSYLLPTGRPFEASSPSGELGGEEELWIIVSTPFPGGVCVSVETDASTILCRYAEFASRLGYLYA